MTLSIMCLFVTVSSVVMLNVNDVSVAFFIVAQSVIMLRGHYAECQTAECCYVGCRGTVSTISKISFNLKNFIRNIES